MSYTSAAYHLPTYGELLQREGRFAGTSWGIFGEGDELGTLNLLTAERTRQAAALIREGLRFGLNLPLDQFDPPLIVHRGNPRHSIFGLNRYHRDDKLDNFFLQASTQIDSLRHFAHPDRGFYGGVPTDAVTDSNSTLGIGRVAESGIVGRGVLLDVERYRRQVGRPIDHQGAERIGVRDLERALEWQGVECGVGDILLLRTGFLDYARGVSPSDLQPRSAGVAASEEMAAWLWDRHFSVIAADNIAFESWPVSASDVTTHAETTGVLDVSSHTGMLHRILIPLLGMTIGELWDLDSLADACHERGRYEVFISAEPLNLRGGVGSPANVLAVI